MKTKRFLICTVALAGCIGVSCKHSSDNTPPPLEPLVTIEADKAEIAATSADRKVTLTATVGNYNSEETEITYQWYVATSADDSEEGAPIDEKTDRSCTITYSNETEKTFYYYCVATVSSASGKSNVLKVSVSKKNDGAPTDEPPPPTDPTDPIKPTKYKITTNAPHATIKGLETEYEALSTVTFTVTPADGYEITSVKAGDEILTPKDGAYSFKMPEKDVVIAVVATKEFGSLDVIVQ